MNIALNLFALLSVGSLVSAQVAQYRVVPSSHEKLEGNTSSTYPLKYEDVRWQMLIDKSAIAKKQAIISSMSFRSDGSGTTTTFASKKLNVSITLYEVVTTPASMSKTFKSNIGTAKGKVVFKKTLVLPAASVVYPLPNPFSVKIPFSSLHSYLPANGNLLIDWQEVGSYKVLAWSADAVSYNTRTISGLVNRIWQNKSCANIRGDQASLSISTSGNGVLGGTIQVKYKMRPSASARLDLMLLGLGSSNRQMGAIKLPLDLGPAGFKSCALAVDLPILIPSLSSPLSLSIPSSQSLSGLPVFFQGLAVDSKARILVPTYNAWQVILRPNVLPIGVAQMVFATKPSTRGGVGFMSTYYYHPVLRLDGKLFQ